MNIKLISSSPEKCTTVITQKGQCCVFPFIYRGQTYYNCTFKNFKKKWCSLTPNYDVDKRWGYCASKVKCLKTMSKLKLKPKPNPKPSPEFTYS